MYEQDSPLNENVPLAKVINLRSQGVPNNQIIQILQNDGYSSDQIFDAMNQADMTQNIGQGMSDPNVEPSQIQNNMEMQPQNYADYQGGYQQSPHREMIEETTEAIVNEKWQEIAQKVAKVEDWKNKLEHRLTVMEANFKNLQDNFDKLHQAIVGKIGEYDQNILNVGTEIKAMEKVFQKILPTFTENVNELSKITQKMKN